MRKKSEVASAPGTSGSTPSSPQPAAPKVTTTQAPGSTDTNTSSIGQTASNILDKTHKLLSDPLGTVASHIPTPLKQGIQKATQNLSQAAAQAAIQNPTHPFVQQGLSSMLSGSASAIANSLTSNPGMFAGVLSSLAPGLVKGLSTAGPLGMLGAFGGAQRLASNLSGQTRQGPDTLSDIGTIMGIKSSHYKPDRIDKHLAKFR